MEPGIENFAGVIIENREGEILLVRKSQNYAYAIPWCRIIPGKNLQECIIERVKDLTGISIHPVFLGPSEHIEKDSHFISFDHVASVDTSEHQYVRDDLDYLWIYPTDFHSVPVVPLTRSILERYCNEHSLEVD
jgi:ADP-ribose pyrophosphatase YjhB (NUDIX family)